MAKTRIELVHRGLKNLGVLPQGQTPSAEEFNSVDDLVDSVIEDLIARDIYYLQDADAVPEEAFMPLGHVLAWASAAEFGSQADAALAALAQKAEIDLKKIQSTRPTYQVLAANYF